MNIGQAAAASGVSAKMIRHYEAIGLIPPAGRSAAGYRSYGDPDVQVLRFIRRARDMGFGIDGIAELLALWRDRTRASADVKRLAEARIADLRQRIGHLMAMVETLEALSASCSGDDRPDCPILKGFETGDLSPAAGAGGIGGPPRRRHPAGPAAG
ncbi:MAG: Cu(I)-responsive transcriptional regulator [Proteobacteria bacterium]|nr:Cu(I)-responsive transcriptional regulator [Pseudomonadota bacterium]MBS0574791.1 Cu(I)-responsive transcriptional regulator [Pseudomonadota bacterium]